MSDPSCTCVEDKAEETPYWTSEMTLLRVCSDQDEELKNKLSDKII